MNLQSYYEDPIVQQITHIQICIIMSKVAKKDLANHNCFDSFVLSKMTTICPTIYKINKTECIFKVRLLKHNFELYFCNSVITSKILRIAKTEIIVLIIVIPIQIIKVAKVIFYCVVANQSSNIKVEP